MLAGTGAAWRPGIPTSAMPIGMADRCLRVVVRRVLDPDGVEGDPDGLASERRERHGHVDRRAGHLAVGERRERDGRAAAFGGDRELGRNRVLGVGDDLEIEMVEADRARGSE